MNHLPSPPNERELPEKQRRRAELLGVIGTRPESSHRRVFVPLVAGASMVALATGGAVVGQSLRGGDLPAQRTPAAAQPESTRTDQSALSERSIRPAPSAHDMSPKEQAAALRACTAEVPGWQRFEPVLGLRFDESPAPKGESDRAATSFVVAEDGDDRLSCALDGEGRSLGGGLFGNSTGKDIPYLFAPADSKGDGFGLYTRPVDRVTLQRDGGPERTAVLRDGYWFLPIVPEDIDWPAPPGETDGGKRSDNERADNAGSDEGNDLIGVPNGYTIRGYDESGELIYDSEQDGPELTCYTDPDGEEVLVHNGVDGGDPDPADCRRTLEWKRP